MTSNCSTTSFDRPCTPTRARPRLSAASALSISRACAKRCSRFPRSCGTPKMRGKPNRFGALGATRHVVFRFVSNFLDWRDIYDRPLWNEWKALLEPVLAAATAPYGYQRGAFPRVMLARMAPGGVIYPHRDENPAAKWPHKIHVPLLTNDGCDLLRRRSWLSTSPRAKWSRSTTWACTRSRTAVDRPNSPDLRILRPRPARAGWLSRCTGLPSPS